MGPSVLTRGEIEAILSRLSYKSGWSFELTNDLEIRVCFMAPDMVTGEPFQFRGRRWKIYENFTDDEVIGAAFLAVKVAEEHETMEFFKLDGVSIFNPHISSVARKRAFKMTFPEESAA